MGKRDADDGKRQGADGNVPSTFYLASHTYVSICLTICIPGFVLAAGHLSGAPAFLSQYVP